MDNALKMPYALKTTENVTYLEKGVHYFCHSGYRPTWHFTSKGIIHFFETTSPKVLYGLLLIKLANPHLS